MHKEILTPEQVVLLPLIKKFNKNFGLIGGTAIGLHLGHRESIDFDLFTDKEFENSKIRKKILRFKKIDNVVKDEKGQFTILVNDVRFTFFHYPFKISYIKRFDDIIKLPDLLTLGAMKAYTLGRRAKWKDYVDLYFIMKKYNGSAKIINKAKKIFKNEFNEKLFRVQLSYFKDIDYTEEIIYKKGFEVDNKIVKTELIKFSLK